MQVKIGDFFFVSVKWGKRKSSLLRLIVPFGLSVAEKKTRPLRFSDELFYHAVALGGGGRRRTMENKVNERSASKGLSNSSVVQHTHRDTHTHPHPHRYTQTLNRERRSSRWALS